MAMPVPASSSLDENPANVLTEALYLEQASFLVRMAIGRFFVPHDVAENFAHDALLAFAESVDPIHSPRSWLLSHVFNSCRYYWRCEARQGPLSAQVAELLHDHAWDLPKTIGDRLDVRRAVDRLDPKCQVVIRLRFVDERSAIEMGSDLGTTKKYAEKLLYGCVDRVRKIYNKITKVRR